VFGLAAPFVMDNGLEALCRVFLANEFYNNSLLMKPGEGALNDVDFLTFTISC